MAAVLNPNSGPRRSRVLSAPLAVVRLDNQAIGKMRDIQLQEQYQRANVTELGNIYNVEVPIISTNFTFTASALVINLTQIGDVGNSLIPGFASNDSEAVAKALILGEIGCTIEIYRLTRANNAPLTIDKNLSKTDVDTLKNATTEILVAKVLDAFIESRNFQLSDGQIATQQVSGRYLTPWQSATADDLFTNLD